MSDRTDLQSLMSQKTNANLKNEPGCTRTGQTGATTIRSATKLQSTERKVADEAVAHVTMSVSDVSIADSSQHTATSNVTQQSASSSQPTPQTTQGKGKGTLAHSAPVGFLWECVLEITPRELDNAV